MNTYQQRSVISKTLLVLTLLLTQCLAGGLSYAADNVIYYHNDALGSPVAATDSAGNIVWKEEYKPYGDRLLDEAGSQSNTVWYTGKEEERALGGLQYFGARWYHSDAGRFMGMDPVAADPANPMSFNRYAYANNNPYRFVDPNGESPVEIATEVLPAAGRSLGALAAYVAGVATGDTALANVAIEGMRQMQVDNIIAISSVAGPPGAGLIAKARKAAKGGAEPAKKLSKVAKEKRVEKIGDKFTKTTKVIPGKGPGQSRAEMEFVKNADGKLIRARKFSFDRGNKLQHKKRVRGGPDGRGAHDNQ